MMRGSLAELEAVLAVSSQGGFRAAARELGMSSSSLSQQIAALETRMGVRLFNRSTRSVVLSAAGEQFVASVGPALEAIRSAVEHVDEHRAEATGTLRIKHVGGRDRMILTPLILDYMRRNPQMSVEIVTEGRWSTSTPRALTPASGSERPFLRTWWSSRLATASDRP